MATRSMGLRASVRGERKQRGKGWKGSFRDRYDVPKATATPILLIRGEYEDFRPEKIKENGGVPPVKAYHVRPSHGLKLAERGPGSYREFVCGDGWNPNASGQCVCCYAADGGDKRINLRDKFAMNILHLSLYTQQPVMGRDGKPLRYQQAGEDHAAGDPIMGWQEVTAARDLRTTMENLDELLASNKVHLYRRKYLDLGSGHLDNLMAIDERASRLCFCGGTLSPVEFSCEKCQEVLCNVDEANLTPEQVADYYNERQRCNSCGHNGFAVAHTICDNCDTPRPMSAFDVVAYVRKTGENTTSKIDIEKVVPLHEYQLPNGEYLIDGYDDTEDGGYTPKWTEAVTKVMTQFDFDQVFPEPDSGEVATVLKIDDPFKKAPAAGARQYAANSGGAKPAPAPGRKPGPAPVRR